MEEFTHDFLSFLPAALLALAEQKWRNQDGQADGSAGPGNGAGA